MATQNFKVVLLGEGRVGKTSILLRYVEGSYADGRPPTVQASYLDKRITIGRGDDDDVGRGGGRGGRRGGKDDGRGGGAEANLSIWDTAGQERFHALGPIYYRDADGAILVYDITDERSFERAQNWTRELRKMVGDERRICIVLVGNKSDLEKNRRVDEGDATRYAESVGARHFRASAKSGEGVDEVFDRLARRMMEQRKLNAVVGLGRNGGGAGGNALGGLASTTADKSKLIVLPPGADDDADSARTRSCC